MAFTMEGFGKKIMTGEIIKDVTSGSTNNIPSQPSPAPSTSTTKKSSGSSGSSTGTTTLSPTANKLVDTLNKMSPGAGTKFESALIKAMEANKVTTEIPGSTPTKSASSGIDKMISTVKKFNPTMGLKLETALEKARSGSSVSEEKIDPFNKLPGYSYYRDNKYARIYPVDVAYTYNKGNDIYEVVKLSDNNYTVYKNKDLISKGIAVGGSVDSWINYIHRSFGTPEEKQIAQDEYNLLNEQTRSNLKNVPPVITGASIDIARDNKYSKLLDLYANAPEIPFSGIDNRTGMTGTPGELPWTMEGSLNISNITGEKWEDVQKKNLKKWEGKTGTSNIDMALQKGYYAGLDNEGKAIILHESPYQVIHGYNPNDPDYKAIKSYLISGIDTLGGAKTNLLDLQSNLNTILASDKDSLWSYDLDKERLKQESPEAYNWIESNIGFKGADEYYTRSQAENLTNYFIGLNKEALAQQKDFKNALFTVNQYEKLGYEVDITDEGYDFHLPKASDVHKALFGDKEAIALSASAFIESPLAVKTWGSGLWEWATGDKNVGKTRHEELAQYSLGLKEGLIRGDYGMRILSSPAVIEGIILPVATIGAGSMLSGASGSLSGLSSKFSSGLSKWSSGLTSTGQKIFTTVRTAGKLAMKPILFSSKAFGTKYGSYMMIGGIYGATEVPRIMSLEPEQRPGAFAESAFTLGLTIGAFKYGERIGASFSTPKARTSIFGDLNSEDLFKNADIKLAQMQNKQLFKQGELFYDEMTIGQKLQTHLQHFKSSLFEPTARDYMMQYGQFAETSRILGEEPVTTYRGYSTKWLPGSAGRKPYGSYGLSDIQTFQEMSYYSVPTEYESYWLNKNAFRLDMDVDLQLRSVGMKVGKNMIFTSDAFKAGKPGVVSLEIDESKIGKQTYMQGDRPSLQPEKTELWGRYAFQKTHQYEEPFWFFKDKKPVTLIPQVDESKIGSKFFMEGDRQTVRQTELWGRYAFYKPKTIPNERPFWFWEHEAPGTYIPYIDESKIGSKFFMEGDRQAVQLKEIFGRYAFAKDYTVKNPFKTSSAIDFIPPSKTFKPTGSKFVFPKTETITETVTKTVEKTTPKLAEPLVGETMDITKFEWYQSPGGSAPLLMTGSLRGLNMGGFASAYGFVNLRALEFLEEGTQYSSKHWKNQRPSMPGNRPNMFDIGSKPSLMTIIRSDNKKMGGMSDTGNLFRSDLFTIGATDMGFIKIGETKLGDLGGMKPDIDMFSDWNWKYDLINEPREKTGLGLGLGLFQSQAQQQMQKQQLEQKQKLGLWAPMGFGSFDYFNRVTPPELPDLLAPPPRLPEDVEDSKNKKRQKKLIKKRKRGFLAHSMDKGLLADLASVTISQGRFGVATHPRLTENIWEMGEKSMFMHVPTVELMSGKKKKTKKSLNITNRRMSDVLM